MEVNKIIQGDCLEELKKLPDNFVNAIITDPPYFFEAHGRGFAKDRENLFMGLKNIGVNKDKNIISKELLDEMIRVCKEKNIFLFCNKSQILEILLFAKKKELCFEIIPLCKNTPMPLSNNQWLPDREWGIHLFKDLEVKGNYYTKKGFFIDDNYKQEYYDH